MTVKEVKVVLRGEAKDFGPAAKAVKQVIDPLKSPEPVKRVKELANAVNTAATGVGKLAVGVKNLNLNLYKTPIGPITTLGKEAAGVAKEAARAAKEIDKIAASAKRLHQQQAAQAAKERRTSFGMGLLQGAGVGEYFPEKGLGANVAGRVVGGAVRSGFGATRQMVGGLASSAFTGTAGLQTALQGIPVAGGFLSGMLGNGLSAAQGALDYRRQMAGMTQYLPGDRLNAAIHGAGGQDFTTQARMALRGEQYRGISGSQAEHGSFAQRLAEAQFMQMAGPSRGAVQKRADSMRSGAVRGAVGKLRSKELNDLSGQGQDFDMDKGRTLDFVSQLLSASGGNTGDLSGGRLRTALGAQTAFGIGPDITAGFMRAQRLGSATSSNQAGIQGMEAARISGSAMGLEGADLQSYLRKIVDGFAQWEHTGIKVNRESLDTMAVLIGGEGGLGPQRSLAVAGQFSGAMTRVAESGPQNAADFALLQDLGGYKGGGIDDYAKASKRMEKGEFAPEDFDKFFSRARVKGMSGEGQQMVLKNLLGQINVPIGLNEAETMLGPNGENSDLRRSVQEKLTRNLQKKTSLVGSAEAGMAASDAAGVSETAMKNINLGVGDKLLPAMENLAKISNGMLQNFGMFSKEINAATAGLASMSKDAKGIFESAEKVLDHFERKVGGMPDR